MKIKVNEVTKVDPKEDINYPVFAEHTDGDVYLFFTNSHAVRVEHKRGLDVGMFSPTMLSIKDSAWTILPAGYSVTFTQG